MLLACLIRETVTGPLEPGSAQGEDLVAIAKFHEVLVRATAEDDQADQRYQS